MKMNDKFKAKVKMFMLKAALTASVSAGVTGVAAQNVQNNDKNSDSVEQGINSRRVEMSVPAIFGEKPINLSRDQLWEMVTKAELNEKQMDAFAKEYAKLVKSPQGLTDLNFNWMTNNLVEDGIFSERQAEVLNHKAVEYNLPVKTPDERVIEDSVRPGEERFKISGTFVNIVESDTKSDTQGHITSYHFDKDGKLHVQSNEIVDLKGLMPPLVQKQDGSYRCGAATGAECARVISQEKSMLQEFVIEHGVYQDLLQKKANGSSLEAHEQAFIKQHGEEMKQHGLTMGKKGLEKINPVLMQMQQTR